MTSSEFVLWLKGFTEGVHEYNITPKQWDLLKEKLKEVEDKTLILESPKFPFGTPNTYPTPMWQEPHYPNPFHRPYVDPYNPYKVTCSSGSFGTEITTTPGTGYITTYNPIQFGSGSFFPISSTTYTHTSGSAWSYTIGGNNIKD